MMVPSFDWCGLTAFEIAFKSNLAAPVLAQESSEAEINRLEDLRYEGMKNADVDTMGKLFADDMVYQTLQGVTYDRPGYIALFKSGDIQD